MNLLGERNISSTHGAGRRELLDNMSTKVSRNTEFLTQQLLTTSFLQALGSLLQAGPALPSTASKDRKVRLSVQMELHQHCSSLGHMCIQDVTHLRARTDRPGHTPCMQTEQISPGPRRMTSIISNSLPRVLLKVVLLPALSLYSQVNRRGNSSPLLLLWPSTA